MESYWIFLIVFILLMSNAQARRQEEEEEEKNPDLDAPNGSWEYKVLQSPRASFKNPHGLADAVAMESAAGWMMLEKLDDKRLRLKRPVSARDHDFDLDFDPYRSTSPKTASVPSGGAQSNDQ